MNVIQDAPQQIQQKQQVSIIMINKTSMNNHAPKDVPKTFQDLKNSLEKNLFKFYRFSKFPFSAKRENSVDSRLSLTNRSQWSNDQPFVLEPANAI